MKYIHDLMTRNLVTCQPSDTLADVEKSMKEHQIRHIPVVDIATSRVVGLLSQKEFLAEAFRITDKFGAHNLRNYLARITIAQCMNQDIQFYSPDMLLLDAGKELLAKRLGCLLVTDEQQHLLGLVSSKDFVRLATELLVQA